MPRNSTARMSLSDLMILICGTALGLGCYVLLDNNLFDGKRYQFGLFQPPLRGWNSVAVIDRAAGILASSLPLFGGWTLAIPILGLRKPRPIRRRSCRGPGMSACVAALTGMLISAGTVGLSFLLRWSFDGSARAPANFWVRGTVFDALIIFAGIAVAATWAVQFSAGRWRPTPDGFDRIGRFLGGLWVASGIVFATRQLLL